jgi:cytochrome c oxidase accessory protein FixG
VIRDAGAAPGPHGDCIDCHQCVTVCPTGIDIRNGVQLECVNCTACIDACNDVMRRIDRPTGLIRLTSHAAVTEGRQRWFTPRVQAYTAVWLVLVGVASYLVVSRPSLDVVVLREPGTLFATLPDGSVANFYTVQVFNRTREAVPFEIAARSPRNAAVSPLGPLSGVEPHGLLESRLLLTMPGGEAAQGAVPVRLEVRVAGRVIQEVASSFVGPPAGPASD